MVDPYHCIQTTCRVHVEALVNRRYKKLVTRIQIIVHVDDAAQSLSKVIKRLHYTSLTHLRLDLTPLHYCQTASRPKFPPFGEAGLSELPNSLQVAQIDFHLTVHDACEIDTSSFSPLDQCVPHIKRLVSPMQFIRGDDTRLLTCTVVGPCGQTPPLVSIFTATWV